MRKSVGLLCLLALNGCAAKMLAASQADCSNYGFTPGSDAYAACVQRTYEGKQEGFRAAMAGLGRSMQQVGANSAATAAPPSNGVFGAGMTAFLRNDTVSGLNRICVYDKAGQRYVITIGATQLCPITLP